MVALVATEVEGPASLAELRQNYRGPLHHLHALRIKKRSVSVCGANEPSGMASLATTFPLATLAPSAIMVMTLTKMCSNRTALAQIWEECHNMWSKIEESGGAGLRYGGHHKAQGFRETHVRGSMWKIKDCKLSLLQKLREWVQRSAKKFHTTNSRSPEWISFKVEWIRAKTNAISTLQNAVQSCFFFFFKEWRSKPLEGDKGLLQNDFLLHFSSSSSSSSFSFLFL